MQTTTSYFAAQVFIVLRFLINISKDNQELFFSFPVFERAFNTCSSIELIELSRAIDELLRYVCFELPQALFIGTVQHRASLTSLNFFL